MSAKAILVPTDFSSTSDAALRYATRMALSTNARLYVLHVPGSTGEHFEADFPYARFETAARERLDTFLTAADIERLHPEYVVRVGNAADEIVRYADICEAELIVMGTHGRSGLAHALMGSVAEQVIRAAPCPVLLVRADMPVARASDSQAKI